MNKKFLSVILFGAVVASTGSFVSCADNDAEIKQLQDQNSDLKAQLAALKTELQAELKSAASASQVAAIEAKLSAIESATAENLQATVDALNGKFDTQEAKFVAINTQLKALEGLQGVDAKELVAALEKAKENAGADMNVLSAMVDALDAQVNVLTSALRALVFQPEFYMDGIEAAEYTYMQYAKLSPTGDRAVSYNEGVYSAKNEKGEWIITGNWQGWVRNNLNNIVAIVEPFDWRYYHEGNVEYPMDFNASRTDFNAWVDNNYNRFWSQDFDKDNYYITLPKKNNDGSYKKQNKYGYDWYENDSRTIQMSRNTLTFAMNPANASIDKEAMQVVTKTVAAMTRGAESAIAIDSCYKDGGYLKVVYHFNGLNQLISAAGREHNGMNEHVDGVILDKVDNTTIIKLNVALDEGSVESDWAAIYETSIQPVAFGLTGAAKAARLADSALDGCAINGGDKVNEAGIPYWKNKNTGAEILETEYNTLPDWDKGNYIKVTYDTENTEYLKNPYMALRHAPTFAIDWKGSLDLAKMVNVHFMKRDERGTGEVERNHREMTIAEVAEKYDLVTEFNAVDYVTDIKEEDDWYFGNKGNGTHPTNYVSVSKAGVVKAGHVGTDGKFIDEPGESAIGKQPLVQVLLKDKDGDVVLDAYIHLVISRSIETVTINTIDLKKKGFNCDYQDFSITWSEYSKLILQDEKVKLSKQELDDYYHIVMENPTSEEVAQFDASGNWLWNGNRFSYITVNKDGNQTANHTFKVAVHYPAQEWVYQSNAEHTQTVYVKFEPNDLNGVTNSKYPNILIPFQFGFTDYAAYALGTKVVNYWYKDQGAPVQEPDESIRFNVLRPDYGQSTVPFVSQITDAWTNNVAKFFNPGQTSWADADHKDWINQNHAYYFHPATNNVVVTNEYTGEKIYLWAANADPYAGAEVLMTKANNDAKNGAIANGNYIGYRIWNYGSYAGGSIYYGLNDAFNAWAPGKFINISDQENPVAYTQNVELTYKVEPGVGMYANKVLMATVGEYKAGQGDDKQTAKSSIIATITADGEINYINNEIAKKVLNAITHDEATQKAYVGIEKYSCVVDAVADNVFPVYFLRPLDIHGVDPQKGEDDVAVGSYVNVYKQMYFEDYRDVKFGYGQPAENIWLAGYYDVNSIFVNLAAATTTLKDANGNAIALKDLTSVKLTYVDSTDKNLATATPANTITKTMAEFNKQSAASESSIEKLTKHFGSIKYENNGTGVEDFSVTIPVEVGYAWGTMKTEITINLKGTMANN